MPRVVSLFLPTWSTDRMRRTLGAATLPVEALLHAFEIGHHELGAIGDRDRVSLVVDGRRIGSRRVVTPWDEHHGHE